MLIITPQLSLPDSEIQLSAIRAQGAGGQNVNKVSSAIHLRFDIRASSLPEDVKTRLLKKSDTRITQEGIVVIKAQTQRTQEKNRSEALDRLAELIRSASQKPKRRIATKPTKGSVQRRVDHKKKLGSTKRLRGSIKDE
ncbi:MAG: alternative ribosome rescue aminoacyl-tRNA hydrolase ArfB [Pseudomonadota bacterium]